MVAVAVELAGLGVVAIRDTDEDPHENNSCPASEAVVELEKTIGIQSVLVYLCDMRQNTYLWW